MLPSCNTGIYEFTFQDGSKTRGRYSYVYTYENGKWMISNHHSSIMPEPAVAAIKKAASMEAAPVMDKMSEMEKRFAEMEKKMESMPSKK